MWILTSRKAHFYPCLRHIFKFLKCVYLDGTVFYRQYTDVIAQGFPSGILPRTHLSYLSHFPEPTLLIKERRLTIFMGFPRTFTIFWLYIKAKSKNKTEQSISASQLTKMTKLNKEMTKMTKMIKITKMTKMTKMIKWPKSTKMIKITKIIKKWTNIWVNGFGEKIDL